MKTLTVFVFIILGFYLIGCIRPHVIISVKKYMNIYVKIFFLKLHVASSYKPPPPDEELDLPTKKPKEKKEKKSPKEKLDKKEKKAKKEKLKKTKKEKQKNKPKKRTRRRLRDIFRRGEGKNWLKYILKTVLGLFWKLIKLVGKFFAVIGKFFWRFLCGRLGFIRDKLSVLRFKMKRRVKEPKKTKLASIHIDIPKMLEMLRNVLGAIFLKLWRYFRVRVKNFHITVASEDAATTAMMYGVICGYGDSIMAILEKALDFKIEKNANVGADCDYLSEEMKMDIEVDISISLGGVLRYIFGIVGTAVGGVLRGIKIRINKEYFKRSKKYKDDMALYSDYKAELERIEAEKAAKKAEKESKAAEKAAKKAAKKAEKESAEAEKTENAEETPENNIENNNDLKAETSERENNYEQQD